MPPDMAAPIVSGAQTEEELQKMIDQQNALMTNLLAQMQNDAERKQKAKNREIKARIRRALRERIQQEGLGGGGDSDSEAEERLKELYNSENDSSGDEGGAYGGPQLLVGQGIGRGPGHQ